MGMKKAKAANNTAMRPRAAYLRFNARGDGLVGF